MSSTARPGKAVEAIDVSIDIDGRAVRAIVTKEALENLCHQPIVGADSMLKTFDSYRIAIEEAIVQRHAADGKEPVVVHDRS